MLLRHQYNYPCHYHTSLRSKESYGYINVNRTKINKKWCSGFFDKPERFYLLLNMFKFRNANNKGK